MQIGTYDISSPLNVFANRPPPLPPLPPPTHPHPHTSINDFYTFNLKKLRKYFQKITFRYRHEVIPLRCKKIGFYIAEMSSVKNFTL